MKRRSRRRRIVWIDRVMSVNGNQRSAALSRRKVLAMCGGRASKWKAPTPESDSSTSLFLPLFSKQIARVRKKERRRRRRRRRRMMKLRPDGNARGRLLLDHMLDYSCQALNREYRGKESIKNLYLLPLCTRKTPINLNSAHISQLYASCRVCYIILYILLCI